MTVINNETNTMPIWKKFLKNILGKPKNIYDPAIFHKLALMPALAWVGLGADGLSSSAYGPEEAFVALGDHSYLAIILAIFSIFTIGIIAYSYTKIIEHFPMGGGGYIVATSTLGKKAGLISGCALLIDYILTITVSIASCGNALFSFLPMAYHPSKIPLEIILIILLIILNIRGVKESINVLAPIFIIFVITHILLITLGICGHIPQFPVIITKFNQDFNNGLATIGITGMLALLIKAYSLGAGTYTGIEAVSNGLQVMQEPKTVTAKTTMLYMTLSLAFTTSGILLCYLLLDVKPIFGKTLNAVIAENIFSSWHWLTVITIIAEGALLIVASQTGFIDGPRVMANMAADKWLPRHLANLSAQLTMRNGIFLMGIPAILLILATHGNVATLVVMYSINVFLTFSISQIGMCKYFIQLRKTKPKWLKYFIINFIGFSLCFTILIVTTLEKFTKGGYVTLLVTIASIIICTLIRNYYNKIQQTVTKLQENYLAIIPPNITTSTKQLEPNAMTAIHIVHDFNGFGINIFFSILQQFPNLYKNFIFVSVVKVDSRSFTSMEELANLENSRIQALENYVNLARSRNIPAQYYCKIATNTADTTGELCREITSKFTKSTVFVGLLKLKEESFYHKFLHSEFPYIVEKRLQDYGITTVILPIKP